MEASDILGKIKVGGGDEGISWASSWAEEMELEITAPTEKEIEQLCLKFPALRGWMNLEKKQPNNVLKKPANNVVKKKPANKVLKKMPANKVLKKKQPETVKEFLDSPVSYPYEMRLGAYLVWKEGKSEKMEGLKLEKEELRLEREFLREMLKDRGECCHSNRKEGLKLDYDVESMDDEAVKAEIRGWESGRKVNERFDPKTGKDEWFIGLLAMSPQQPLPTGSYMRKAAKEEKHPSGTESEPRTKVSS